METMQPIEAHPLHTACYNGETSVVLTLIADPKMDINMFDCYYKTPLYIATERGRMDIMEILLADPRIVTNSSFD